MGNFNRYGQTGALWRNRRFRILYRACVPLFRYGAESIESGKESFGMLFFDDIKHFETG